MKKNKKLLIIIIVALVLILSGSLVAVFLLAKPEEETVANQNTVTEGTFGEYTTSKCLKDIPVPEADGLYIGAAVNLGKEDYVIDVNGTTPDIYKDYINQLEKAGYKKFCDNGENGLDNTVFTTNFTKDKLAVTVYYIKKYNKMYVAASERPLSDHMIDKEEYHAESENHASLHMLQLNDNGNSFVIVLRNGHLIVEDGGIDKDAPYLVDYLESLVPEGDKPVIEGWFITHAHGDHMGALSKIIFDDDMAKRLIVNGFYFVEPSKKVLEIFTTEAPEQKIWNVNNAPGAFKNEQGMFAKMYRPHLGDRFYFDGVTIEIPHTLEQLGTEAWYDRDFNDSSTWYMHYFGEQKFLHAGDAGTSSTKRVMSLWDPSYFDLDVFAVLHHGINVPKYFTDYLTIKTLLYTSWKNGSFYIDSSKHAHLEENQYLRDASAEYMCHGNGTVVLTFPYKVGEAKILPSLDWKYSYGQPVRRQWGVQ